MYKGGEGTKYCEMRKDVQMQDSQYVGPILTEIGEFLLLTSGG